MNPGIRFTVVLVFLSGIALGASLFKLFGQSATGPGRITPEADRLKQYENLARLEGTFKSFPAIADVVSRSVVSITAFRGADERFPISQEGIARGSGFVLDGEGHILTNNHVIEEARQIRVQLAGGVELPATLVGADPATDIALLQVKAEGLRPAMLGNSDQVLVGEWVMALGSPYGLTNSVTTGIVSAVGRSGVGDLAYQGYIQTDAAVNPGNSGGPLVNLRGEVIGITSSIMSRSGGYDGISFAIPVNRAKFVIERLKSGGTVVRGYVGALFSDLNDDLVLWVNASTNLRVTDVADLRQRLKFGDTGGVFILKVIPGGPAEKSGLRLGDLVTEIDGQAVVSQPDLKERVALLTPGQTVAVKFLRNGKALTAQVEIQQRPPAPR